MLNTFGRCICFWKCPKHSRNGDCTVSAIALRSTTKKRKPKELARNSLSLIGSNFFNVLQDSSPQIISVQYRGFEVGGLHFGRNVHGSNSNDGMISLFTCSGLV